MSKPEVTGPVDFNHPAALRWDFSTPGNPKPHEKRVKIAIMGFASSSRHMGPWNDASWEVWCLNQLYRHIPRADRQFEVHHNWNDFVVPGTDHEAWIKEAQIPVYMDELHVAAQCVTRFPIEKTEALYRRFFTSSIAHEIAFAITELIDPATITTERPHGYAYPGATLALFGIDLAVGTEYAEQLPCASFWLGCCHMLGIDLQIPAESSLLTATHVYGYELEPDLGLLKLSELDAFMGMLAGERDKSKFKAYAHDGATQAIAEVRNLMLLRARGVKTGDLAVLKE